MSKALVIKGANFSTNKVETVTLSSPVPCTGLALSQDSMTPTSLGVAGTLIATPTPIGTTDTVTWQSSDTDVATVENGVVTCVGVGSATITATCGEQTATCEVTATVTYTLDTDFYVEDGARYSGSMNLTSNPVRDHIGRTTNTKARMFYSTEEYGNYQVFTGSQNAGQYAIPIPNGATKINFDIPTSERTILRFVLVDAFSKQTYIGGADGQSALGIYNYTQVTTDGTAEIDFSDYAENANAFIMSWELDSASATDISSITATTSVTFS